MSDNGDLPITELLKEWSRGDPTALDRLIPLIYRDLRAMAGRHLRREGPTCTLQPTELVHEVFLRFQEAQQPNWENRTHFFGTAAEIMRRILIDQSRRRKAAKRDGLRVALEEAEGQAAPRSVELEQLDEAIRRLGEIDPRAAEVVKLRYFAGLDIEETAAALEVSPATVKREWTVAKAWLLRALSSRAAGTS